MISTPWTGFARRVVAPVLLLLTLGAAVAACGGGSSTASPTTSTTGPAGSSLSTFRSCLTTHGVPPSAAGSLFGRRRGNGNTSSSSTPPSSTPQASSPRPTIPAQYQAAFNACRSLLPTGPFGGLGGAGGVNSAQFAAYRNCLELNGVTLPTTTTTPGQTPQTGGFGRGGGAFGQLRNNPKFQAAVKACQKLLPARSSTPSASS